MRKLILEKTIIKFKKIFKKEESGKINIFYRKKYVYLTKKNDEVHILLDGSLIRLIDYSPDPREHLYYEYSFEYLDDFLLKYFENVSRDIEIGLAFRELKGNGNSINFLELSKRQQHYNGVGQKIFLSYLPALLIFISYCLGLFKIRKKEYLYFFTYVTTFLGCILLISFYILIFCYNYPANLFMPILFIGGLIFLLNGYVDIEKRIRAKKEGRKVVLNTDFWIGVIGLILLFVYAIYHYLIK